MRMRGAYVRTGFKTGTGLRKGGVVRCSTRKRIPSGIGVHKAGKNVGKIYTKYR